MFLEKFIIIFLNVPETSINIENKHVQVFCTGEFEKILPSHLEHERAKVIEVFGQIAMTQGSLFVLFPLFWGQLEIRSTEN